MYHGENPYGAWLDEVVIETHLVDSQHIISFVFTNF